MSSTGTSHPLPMDCIMGIGNSGAGGLEVEAEEEAMLIYGALVVTERFTGEDLLQHLETASR